MVPPFAVDPRDDPCLQEVRALRFGHIQLTTTTSVTMKWLFSRRALSTVGKYLRRFDLRSRSFRSYDCSGHADQRRLSVAVAHRLVVDGRPTVLRSASKNAAPSLCDLRPVSNQGVP
jgi:hypothetical protein